MNNITSYNNNLDNVTYAGKDLNRINSTENNTKKQDNQNNKINSNSTDSIEITQKNDNIINTKKACDAFQETASEFGIGDGKFPAGFYFNMIQAMMKNDGISVPDFKLDGENLANTNFGGFVDKLKEFTNSLLINNEMQDLPSNFFEFCDKYKENLTKNGCK